MGIGEEKMDRAIEIIMENVKTMGDDCEPEVLAYYNIYLKNDALQQKWSEFVTVLEARKLDMRSDEAFELFQEAFYEALSIKTLEGEDGV